MAKKILVLLLALVMALSCFACKKKDKGGEDVTTDNTVTSAADGEEDINPHLAAIDGEGKVIRILAREQGLTANYWYEEIDSSELDQGNVVNAAVVERNRAVKEKYNIEIERTEINYNQIASTMETQIRGMAGEEDSYHIAIPMLLHAFNMANNGLNYSIDALEFVDPEKPYWRGDIYKATTIANKNYFISGDINTSVYGSSWATFFNEEIVRDYNIENPYDLVKKGEWTIEKMLELSAKFGGDNGDSVYDTADSYAICSGTWVWQCFMYGSGYKFIDKDNQDIPYIVTEDSGKRELIQNSLTQIVQIMNTPTLAINANKAGLNDQPSKLFCNGQVLFYFANVNNAFIPNDIKDMEQEYGILPLPKLNTAQETYTNAVHPHHSSTIVVPKNISKDLLPLLSSVLEDMAYYSYENVKPAYYDTVITYRSVRNEDSYEMMSYVFENFNIDFGLIMTGTFGFDEAIRGKINQNDINFSSYLTGFNSLWKMALDKVVKTYGGE